jgi:hypothetical protein
LLKALVSPFDYGLKIQTETLPYLAAALSVAIYGAFFATVFARPLFGGTLYDDNGYLPFKPPLGPQHWRWDANVTAFSILSGIALAGIVAMLVA